LRVRLNGSAESTSLMSDSVSFPSSKRPTVLSRLARLHPLTEARHSSSRCFSPPPLVGVDIDVIRNHSGATFIVVVCQLLYSSAPCKRHFLCLSVIKLPYREDPVGFVCPPFGKTSFPWTQLRLVPHKCWAIRKTAV